MKSLIMKGLVISLSLGFFLYSLPALQAESEAKTKKININTASLAELQKLPRIGEKVAQRIIEYRKEHGKFKKIEELMKIPGIGEKVFNNLKDLITVGDQKKLK